MSALPDDVNRWHLDKRVPIALVLTIIIQTAGAVWWASAISARVTHLEQLALTSAAQPERIVRVETQVDGLKAAIDRIERKLDRLTEQLAR